MRFAGCALMCWLVAAPASAQSIALPRSVDPATQFAAQELTRYLKEMGVSVRGVKFELGDTRANQKLWRSPDARAVTHDEAFLIRADSRSRTVHLTGRSPRATLYAVYQLLESQGCRFFGPGPLGEVIPQRRQLQLQDGQELHQPAIHTREIGGAAPPGIDVDAAIDWRVRNRLNRAFALRPGRYADRSQRKAVAGTWASRGGYREWQWISHNFPFVFPPEQQWFERHPEYFALYQGRRRRPGIDGKPYYGGGNLALTNPDVIRHMAEFANKWFGSHPAGEVVPVWPNDGPIYWDESPAAMELGGRNFTSGPAGSMTGRLVHFANEVARQIAPKYREQRLILLPAYSNYLQPLENAQLEPNVLVQYCYHGDYAHGPEQSDHNAKSVQQMKTWSAQAKHFGVWEYFLIGDFHQAEAAPILLPLVYRIRDTVRFLHRINCQHYFVQSTPAYQNHNALVYYALARYLWDPSLDADALIDDYCHSSFGEQAGRPMATFYRAMEVACQESSWAPTSYADVVSPSPLVFSPELLQELSALLKQAQACRMDQKQQARLAHVVVAFEGTTAAVREAPSVDLTGDRASRLVRTRDAYVMDPDGPVVSPQRFEALVQQAIDTGQGGPQLERTAFRSRRRVEAVQRIRAGRLTVGVLPGLGGRLVRLVDQQSGWDFLAEGPSSQDISRVGDVELNYGGYDAVLSSPDSTAGMEQSFSVSAVEADSLLLETSGEGWTLQRRCVVQSSPNVLQLQDRLTLQDPQPDNAVLQLRPQLTLGGQAADVELYRRDDRGRWQRAGTLGQLHGQTAPPLATKAADGFQDEVAVWQPATHRGLLLRVTTRQKSQLPQISVLVAEDGSWFRLDRVLPAGTLSTGESLQVEQTWQPFLNPREIGQRSPRAVARKPAGGITGEPASWTRGPSGRGDAAVFDAGHRMIFSTEELTAEAGTLAAWVRVASTEGAPQWILSSGDNRDTWLAWSVSNGSVSWLAKLGKAPYTGPGEAYTSLHAELFGESAGAPVGQGVWKHVAVSWERQSQTAQVALVIRVDGQVVQQRDNLPWPCGLPLAPLIIGGNSASSRTASPVALDDLVLLNRPLADDEEAKLLMQSPETLSGLRWHFPFNRSVKFESSGGR